MRAGQVVALALAAGLLPGSAFAQALYFSGHPTNQCWGNGYVWSVYLHSPDDSNFDGATLWIDAPFTLQNLTAFETSPGVTLVSGEPFSGMELSWTSRELTFEPLVTMTFDVTLEDLGGSSTVVRDGELSRPGGGSVALEDFWTCGAHFACCHCTGCVWSSDLPDTAEVPVASTTAVGFRLQLECYQYTGTYISVSDDRGWVQASTPSGIGAVVCGEIFYEFWTPFEVTVTVPPGTPFGTISTASIVADHWFDGLQFQLRAIATVPTETTTWGRIKALYGD